MSAVTPPKSLPNPFRTLGVVLEERFKRKSDGSIWSTGNFGDAFWQRYLEVFDAVVVIARIEQWDGRTPVGAVTRDPRVSFAAVPIFRGAVGLAKSLRPVSQSLRRAVIRIDCAVLRLPGQIGMLAGPILRREGKPYFVEMVGDPDGIFPAGLGRLAAPLIRQVARRSTVSLIGRSSGVSYVTERTLQTVCPPSPHVPTSHYSSLELADAMFAKTPIDPSRSTPLSILSVGTLTSRSKGMDVLLAALRQVIDRGYSVTATVVGAGAEQSKLEALADRLKLSDHVRFSGHLKHADVLGLMRSCDLYIQSSRSEGLARTVIEAMATGRPVIATRVGGLVELVADEWLVPSDDPEALADAIVRAWPTEIRAAMSAASVRRAQDFLHETLAGRRRAFYQAFIEAVRHDA
ncbi:MAG: glycosyltransferase family 4 protein [Devosia sp.]